jgi:hypothetical protein
VGENITQQNITENHTHNYNSAALAPNPTNSTFPLIPSIPDMPSIMTAYRHAKPFEKDQVAANYHGLEVTWLMRLESISLHHDGRYLIILSLPENMDPRQDLVSVQVNIQSYPKLKVIDKGHEIWIHGRIRNVGTLGIGLDPSILHIV